MNRCFLLIISLVILVQFCSTVKSYKMNLNKNVEIESEVFKVAKSVNYDFPEEINKDNEDDYKIYLFQNFLTGIEKKDVPVKFPKDFKEKIHKNLESSVMTYSFNTKFSNNIAFHEITAGLIQVPWNRFLEKFEPARDWGRYLYGYIGGELVIDKRNEAGHSTLQRERMALTTPWYAIGAPLMDMSKYEVIEYKPESVVVNWKVTESQNKSVFTDIGYVKFQKYIRNEKEFTLVIFNSIHRVEAGWLGNLMPDFISHPISRKTLRDMFSGHIKNYKEILNKRL